MSDISLFENVFAKEPSEKISLEQFLYNIKNGKWKDLSETVRSSKSKDDISSAKKNIPAATISGLFSQRNEQSLIKHSGFICIDFDKEVDKSQLAADPYTYAIFDSVSKRGVAIVVKVNPNNHSESFDWLKSYYFAQYGLVIDPAPRNPVSLRIASYDPDLHINPKSKVSKTKKQPKSLPKSIPVFYTEHEINDIVQQIIQRNIDIAPDYETYFQIAAAFSDEFGESGRQYFHSVCSISPKYSETQADKQYDYALKRSPSGKKITIGTFYYYAKQAGITLPSASEDQSKAITIATIAKKDGLEPSQIAELVVSQTGLPQTQANKIAKSVADRHDITLSTVATEPEHLIESLILFISNKYPMKRNQITGRIELKNNAVLAEEDINDIYLHARAAFNSPNITKDLVQSIIFSNHTPTFNPLTEFIKKNIHIESKGHIDALINCIHTDTPHAKNFIRKWLIAMHAAIDGHPVRLMLVFTGPQYNGKTEFFRRLLPPELKSFYAESKLDRGKDDELLMCQKLIVMDDEMGGKSKQDEKRLKELTSKEFFSLRAPYRKDNIDYKRLAILCGTSNPTEIITDPTGNTRILPVEVQSIDFDAINSIDRTDLFMEAYHAYKAGEPYQLSKSEVDQLSDISENFTSISFERELILKFFMPYNGVGHRDDLTATEIKDEIEVNSKQQIRNMVRFGIELRKALGKPKSARKNGFPAKIYPVVRLNDQNVVRGNFSDFSEPTDNQPPPF